MPSQGLLYICARGARGAFYDIYEVRARNMISDFKVERTYLSRSL